MKADMVQDTLVMVSGVTLPTADEAVFKSSEAHNYAEI